MNQFIDTLSVFIGNILRLKPTGWQEARRVAAQMRQTRLEFKPSKVVIDGEETDVVAPHSPLAYLGEAVLDALGFVGVVWLIHKIVMGFLVALPWLLVIAALGLILRASGSKSPEPQVS
jgi:hypothetical protein